MDSIWIVVFAALIQPSGKDFREEQLAVIGAESEIACRATVDVFLAEAIKQDTIKAVGVTIDCFEYYGTLEEYKASVIRERTQDILQHP